MSHLMTSDVAWQLPGSDPKQNIRLWYDDKGLAGYVWFQPTCTFYHDVRTDLPHQDGLMNEMLAWVEGKRALFDPGVPFYLDVKSMDEWAERIRNPKQADEDVGRVLVASAFESATDAVRLLERNGFAATEHFEPFLIRGLDGVPEDVPEVDLADDITIESVAESKFEELVATHRASWAPASGFDMDRYLAVRSIGGVFDPELNIAAEGVDGSFGSYTICWADPVSKVGSFEPFGTRPEWRGSGVSQAVIYEGLRRLKSKGMEFARTYTAGFNHQAFRLYRSCGFELIDRSRTYTKTV